MKRDRSIGKGHLPVKMVDGVAGPLSSRIRPTFSSGDLGDRVPAMSGPTERFTEIVSRLEKEYGDAPSLLNYRSPFELLIAVILSAQTTDDAVNATLPELFSRFPDARSLADADPGEIEEIIHSLGFYRQKTRSIIGTAKSLVNDYGGEVPDSMKALVNLPGVGRKSAGVVLLHIYGTPAIIVDTHFGRVVRRLGFSSEKDPVKLERNVAEILPREFWNDASMRLNYHGRRYCFARKPDCGRCPVADLCPVGGLEI